MSAADAIKAVIEAAVPGIKVYVGRVDSTPPARYVALYADDGIDRTEKRVSQQRTGNVIRWQTTCVAPDAAMLSWLRGRVVAAFSGRMLTVAGAGTEMAEHEQTLPPRPDETVINRPVMYAVDRFVWAADRPAA